jgi:glycosyltransferase involved in cell wall biosynthesis
MVDGITVIDTTNDVLLNRYSGYTENTSVIYNVPNVKPIKKSEDNDILKIVYVGLIDRRKGVHVLLEAFNEMLNTHDVKLVLIGGSVDNTLSKLRKRAEELGIQDKIQFVGRVEYNVVHDYLCSTDIAVAPYQPIQKNKISRWNSRKIPDYMNASLPIVGPNYGGFAEIIKDTNCGIVVDTTDQIALAEGLRSLLDNPEKRKEYGENGREAIKSQYNWEQESSKLLHLVESTLNNTNDR